jgi:hypothetical protein
LGSCSRSRPPIGRIVLTSSCSAVRYGSSFAHNNAADRSDGGNEPPLLDESNWSNVDYCKQHQVGFGIDRSISFASSFQLFLRLVTGWLRVHREKRNAARNG